MILWVLGIREFFHFFKVSFLLLYSDLPFQVCISSLPISHSPFATSAHETPWYLVLLAVFVPHHACLRHETHSLRPLSISVALKLVSGPNLLFSFGKASAEVIS